MRCSASHDAALKDSAAFLKHQAELPAMLAEKARGKGWLIEPFSRNFVTSLEQSTLPLFGLTFVAKGNIKVRGLPCTFGLKVPAIAHCDNDGAIIKYFEDLGATLTGITNLDEGCLTHLGENPHYGTIQNPRDPNLRALGTSGGSAAVVAADLVARKRNALKLITLDMRRAGGLKTLLDLGRKLELTLHTLAVDLPKNT